MKYKESVSGVECNASSRDHYSGVSSGLESYLASVVSIHSQMRAVRVSRHLEMKKLSRLELTSAESRAAEIRGPGHHPPPLEQVHHRDCERMFHCLTCEKYFITRLVKNI